VVATKKLIDLSNFDHASTLRGADSMPWPIQEALNGQLTRGGRRNVSSHEGFGVSYLDLWVE
jgi:hypothetical protein